MGIEFADTQVYQCTVNSLWTVVLFSFYTKCYNQ
jgi:hypothetical protein